MKLPLYNFYTWLYWQSCFNAEFGNIQHIQEEKNTVVLFWMNPSIKLNKLFNFFVAILPSVYPHCAAVRSCLFLMQAFNLCWKVAMPYAEYNLTFKSYFTISFLPLQVSSTLTMAFSKNNHSNNMGESLPNLHLLLNTFLILVCWLQFWSQQFHNSYCALFECILLKKVLIAKGEMFLSLWAASCI